MRLTVYFPDDNPAIHNWTGGSLSIGRLADNDVFIDDDSISSRHAEISGVEGAMVLRDLDSTNGTFLNREQITGQHPLGEGDEIYFGGVRTVFMEPSGAEVDEPEVAVVATPDLDFVPDAGEGGHPDGFRPLSPLPPEAKKRDTLALAAWGSLGLGVAAALYALVVVATS